MHVQATRRENVVVFEAPSLGPLPKIWAKARTRLFKLAVGGLVLYWAWLMFSAWAGFFQEAAARPVLPAF
jgi:hypothetical protein